METNNLQGKVKCFTDYGITYAYLFKHDFPSKADLLAEKKSQAETQPDNSWEDEY